MKHPRAGALAVLAGLVGMVLMLTPTSAVAADPVRPEPGHPWFGPHLDFPLDQPADYVERLGGLEASSYTLPIPYPLDEGALARLSQFARLVAERGAVLLVDVQPAKELRDYTDEEAADFAEELRALNDELGSHVLLRFAPEMNGSWETWGQQPGAYVAAFRQLSEAMDDVEETDWSEMVWAPVYGSGYPYRRPDRTQGALQDIIKSERGRLDTNNNGNLDAGDDSYQPYYPGDEWVDWVGLSMYRLGQSQGVNRNGTSPPTEFRQRLDEQWGYGSRGGGTSFYARYAVGHDRPMVVETAAFYNRSFEGPRALEVKRAWWSQVFGDLSDYPRINLISWLEVARAEPEALQVDPVDWRVSTPPRVAAVFARDLEASDTGLGPVLPLLDPLPPGSTDGGIDGDGDGDSPDASGPEGPVPADEQIPTVESAYTSQWLLGAAGLLVLALLVGLALPGWRYRLPPNAEHRLDTPRDERLDLLRGGLLLGLLVLVGLASGLGKVDAVDSHLVPVGAGLLLLVSGAAHGLRAHDIGVSSGPWAASVTRFRRARTVYVVALSTAALVLLVDALPGVDNTLGTYADASHLLDYPPPAYAVGDLVFLTVAPWLVATLGLFALLALAAPLALLLVQRGWWWAVLVVSWILLALGVATGAEVLPLGSETTLPVLIWQAPFVHGLVLGHERDAVESRGRLLGVLVALAVALYAGLVASDLVTFDVPEGTVVAAVAVAALVFVTTCFRPLHAALGWLLGPVGRRPLLVVPVTVVLVVVLDLLR